MCEQNTIDYGNLFGDFVFPFDYRIDYPDQCDPLPYLDRLGWTADHCCSLEYFFHLGYFLASCDHRRYNHNRLEQLHCLERKKTEQPLSTWKSVDQALRYTDAFPGRRIFCRLLEIDRANVKYRQRTRNSASWWQELSCRLFIFKNIGRGLWYFQFVANYLRFFQGSSMVIFSVFDSNPRLLFWAILSSKRTFLRIFPQFFIKVFAKVGWEILCFLWHKTENLALLCRVLL